MPLLATPKNMAHLAIHLMGQPYGWRNIEGYRDCSALTKDLLMPFGFGCLVTRLIKKSGRLMSLEGKNEKEIQELLVQFGQPFFSLITIPGHIVLYVGAYQDTPSIYHNMWGFRVKNKPDKRIIVGRVVVMPLGWGRKYVNKGIVVSTLFNRTTGLLLLSDRLTNPTETLPLFESLVQE